MTHQEFEHNAALKSVLFALALAGVIFAGSVWWEKTHEIKLTPRPGITPGEVDLARKMHAARVEWCQEWADSGRLGDCIMHSEEAMRMEVEGL
jgi:hypothetical protein